MNIRQALTLAPNDAYSLSLLGNLKYRQQKYDEALDALGRAAKLDPENAQIQNYLGTTLAEKGLRGPAETAFRKAIEFDPKYGDAHVNLAVIYISQQPPLEELARWHYQKALAAGHAPDPSSRRSSKSGSRVRQTFHELTIRTRGRGLYEFTSEVAAWVSQNRLQNGLLTLHVRHTSASLLIQENADPDVRRDLEQFFARLVPDGDPMFLHTVEGDDDMPAHIRTALTSVNLSIPLSQGRLALGTWQGLYLWEHRRASHSRTICLHFIGE